MISRFELKNIALVDYAEIVFEKGVNILSGETGSGKSVIIDSINFVLGAKADKSMIRYGADECFASATFDLEEGHAVHSYLKELDVDDDSLVISRKYNMDGKGVIKVNGVTVTAGMLKKITASLVDVHGQSEHFSLLKEDEQLRVIDNYFFDEIEAAKLAIAPILAEYNEICSKLRSLGGNESERAIRQDVLKYQINEIEKASLVIGEQAELIKKKQIISNAEKIIAALNIARASIEDDGGAIDSLNSAGHALSSIGQLNDDYSGLYSRVDSVLIEVSDAVSLINDYLDGFDFDKDEAEKIDDRLEIIKRLTKKYGKDESAVLRFYDNAVAELDRLQNFDKLSADLIAQKSQLKKKLFDLMVKLHNVRMKSANEFCNNVQNELHELGMPKARFAVNFAEMPDFEDLNECLSVEGFDNIEFMFSANLGEPLKPLAKIISGGEVSRFMLAVRTQTAKAHSVSTFIFDEIDAGISGVIAGVVAEKFAKISLDKQIIAITHLPQIACMADNALLIEKIEEGNKTKTIVRNLDSHERIREITRLVGGNSSSDAATAHANEMILAAQNFKFKLLNK